VVLRPGQGPVTTPDATITVAAMQQAGDFVFSVTVTDDAGLSSTATFRVTVRPG